MKALLALLCLASSIHAASLPNVIVILADDMGYGDPRCYNPDSKIPTPHLDRLAAEGVRFTDAHTPSSVCTPTRYGLLTGRYCWRTHLKRGVLDGFDPALVEPGRLTLATMFKAKGYSTACIGKWHLGMNWKRKDGSPMPDRLSEGKGIHRGGEEVDFTQDTVGGPLDHGFDSWFGISASLDMAPYAYIEGRRVTQLPTAHQPGIKETALSTSEGVRAPDFTLEKVLPDLTRRAVSHIESQVKSASPFFLYFPLPSPHLPVVPSAGWLGKTGAGLYADFAAQTDATVGALLVALDRTGQAENTLILFTSDNGGLWHQWEPKEADDLVGYKTTPRGSYNHERGHHSNAHLRGTKADAWEGGHRVPFIVRWPAQVKPRVSPALVELTDVCATLAAIIGTDLPSEAAEDSHSFLAALLDAKPARDFAVHHSLQGVFALREGPWKLITQRGSGGFSFPKNLKPQPGEPTHQLYNLESDPSETQNLASQEPGIAQRMAERLAEIQSAPSTRPEAKR